MSKKSTAVSVANAKREFSELLGRVAYGGETIVITRRGRPMAKLVPVLARKETTELENVGWLDEDDPFFDIVVDIVGERARHSPRAFAKRKRTPTSGSAKLKR